MGKVVLECTGEELIAIVNDQIKLTFNRLLYVKYKKAELSKNSQLALQFETAMVIYFNKMFEYLAWYFSKRELKHFNLVLVNLDDILIDKSFRRSKEETLTQNIDRAVSQVEIL